MSTRSAIYLKTSKGFKSIYCHWDGYPAHNGKILLKHYNKAEKVKALIELGCISFLGKDINPGDKPHSFDNPADDVTVFYGRDRGEKGTEATFKETFQPPKGWEEYIYLFKNGKWYFTPMKHKLEIKDFKVLTLKDCKR